MQNIDGLHTAAGSRQVVELHGSLWETRCVRCRRVQGNRDMPICEALEGRVSGCCSMSLYVITIKCKPEGWYAVRARADQERHADMRGARGEGEYASNWLEPVSGQEQLCLLLVRANSTRGAATAPVGRNILPRLAPTSSHGQNTRIPDTYYFWHPLHPLNTQTSGLGLAGAAAPSNADSATWRLQQPPLLPLTFFSL